MKSLLLSIWREVPFPSWMRRLFLRILNPSFMVGAMALIQDEQGRVLVLEHTYRRHTPWGMPGGWLKNAESPEAGLVREVYEETGFQIEVQELVAAAFYEKVQLDLCYRCRVISGTYTANEETRSHRWVAPADLPPLLPNQQRMLRRAGVFPRSTPRP